MRRDAGSGHASCEETRATGLWRGPFGARRATSQRMAQSRSLVAALGLLLLVSVLPRRAAAQEATRLPCAVVVGWSECRTPPVPRRATLAQLAIELRGSGR